MENETHNSDGCPDCADFRAITTDIGDELAAAFVPTGPAIALEAINGEIAGSGSAGGAAGGTCRHCGGALALANPSGFCSHIHYPEGCDVCLAAARLVGRTVVSLCDDTTTHREGMGGKNFRPVRSPAGNLHRIFHVLTFRRGVSK